MCDNIQFPLDNLIKEGSTLSHFYKGDNLEKVSFSQPIVVCKLDHGRVAYFVNRTLEGNGQQWGRLV